MADTLKQTFFQRLDIHARREFVTDVEDCALYDDVFCKELCYLMRQSKLRMQIKKQIQIHGKNGTL